MPEGEQELSRRPSVIAHEVANPLAAARALLELCTESLRNASGLAPTIRGEVLEDLLHAREGIDRAVDYLRSIQDRSRGGLGLVERFDAVRVVRSCVTLEQPYARERGVAVTFEASIESAYLYGETNGLFQILTNLLHNAADASRGRRGPIVVRGELSDGALVLTVVDRGVGIPPEHVERVFERGFTTKGFGSGTGTGLAVVRDIVTNKFGGTVRARSTVGEGTEFTVTLPLPPQRPRSTAGAREGQPSQV